MPARTIYNCSIISKNTKKKIEEPQQWYMINRCEGYRKNDDKLYSQCKKCKFCIARED